MLEGLSRRSFFGLVAAVLAVPKAALSFSAGKTNSKGQSVPSCGRVISQIQMRLTCEDCGHAALCTFGENEPMPRPDSYLLCVTCLEKWARSQEMQRKYLTADGFQALEPLTRAGRVVWFFRG